MHPLIWAYQLSLYCPFSHPPFTDMCQRPPGQYPPPHTAVTDGTLTIAPKSQQAGLPHARLHPNNSATIDTVTHGDPAQATGSRGKTVKGLFFEYLNCLTPFKPLQPYFYLQNINIYLNKDGHRTTLAPIDFNYMVTDELRLFSKYLHLTEDRKSCRFGMIWWWESFT